MLALTSSATTLSVVLDEKVTGWVGCSCSRRGSKASRNPEPPAATTPVTTPTTAALSRRARRDGVAVSAMSAATSGSVATSDLGSPEGDREGANDPDGECGSRPLCLRCSHNASDRERVGDRGDRGSSGRSDCTPMVKSGSPLAIRSAKAAAAFAAASAATSIAS